jgi:xanthine dehydrogenase iron-sulfur cluster and FAD-binding subunit A
MDDSNVIMWRDQMHYRRVDTCMNCIYAWLSMGQLICGERFKNDAQAFYAVRGTYSSIYGVDQCGFCDSHASLRSSVQEVAEKGEGQKHE